MRQRPDGVDGGQAMNREDLFEKHLRGELTVAEATALKQLLANNPEAGRAFVEYANETALLVRVGTQVQSARGVDNVVPFPALDGRITSPQDSDLDRGSGRGTTSARILKWGSMAACLAALAILLAWLNQDSDSRIIAEVYVSGHGVQVTRAGALLKGNDIELLPRDVITTPTNKTAVIVYKHEATRLELQPGSVVVFGNASQGKRFELRRGIIEARVSPQPEGRPMAVETVHAVATVLGTEFVMRADQQATKLDVLEGKVELACRLTGKKVKVKAGF